MNTRRLLRTVLLLAPVFGVLGTGCIVRETRPGPPCPNAVWVEGHYDRWGRWHRAHWLCG